MLDGSQRHFDKFDKAFAHYFEGIDKLDEILTSAKGIPEEWMKSEFERLFSKEEMEAIESQGGFDELMKNVMERNLSSESIYNMDETGFSQKSKNKKVIAVHGSKNVWSKSVERSFHLTMVCCVSASCFVVP